jgi:hypothetical protein
MYAVRPEFGPTLPELLSGRSKAWRYALMGGYVLAIVVVLYVLLLRGDPSSTHVVKHGDVTFNLTYDAALKEKPPVGNERLRLEGNRGREVTVRPLDLPRYTGQADGFLPAYAETLLPAMRAQFDGFQIRRDGRPSVNRIPGYEIFFQYKRHGNTSYGRRILLLDSYAAGSRDGVDMLLVEDRSKVVPNADAVGTAGSLKTLLHSFSFGSS